MRERVRGDEMTTCTGNPRACHADAFTRADYRIAPHALAQDGDFESFEMDD